MSSFRRVDGAEASPDALGILVPPGRRTLVILRPRALDYDLIPLQAPGANGPAPGLADIDHKDAPGLSQRLFRALEAWANGGSGRVEAVAAPGGEGFWVRADVGAIALLACRRAPGEPYRPATFATLDEARDLTVQLAVLLCPPPGVTRELYFNTKHFAH